MAAFLADYPVRFDARQQRLAAAAAAWVVAFNARCLLSLRAAGVDDVDPVALLAADPALERERRIGADYLALSW